MLNQQQHYTTNNSSVDDIPIKLDSNISSISSISSISTIPQYNNVTNNSDSSGGQLHPHLPHLPHLQSLNCEKYNGPFDSQSLSEMVYWWKIPQDESFVNSFQRMHSKEDDEKYFLFEPDGAGWNNLR